MSDNLPAEIDEGGDVGDYSRDAAERLRQVMRLKFTRGYSIESIARALGVSADTVHRDMNRLASAVRAQLFQDAAYNKSLMTDVIAVIASSRYRLHELSLQLENMRLNYDALIEAGAVAASMDRGDPVDARLRAAMILAREVRGIHSDFRVEENHLMGTLERTGLLQKMRPGEALESAGATLDLALISEIAQALPRALRVAGVDDDKSLLVVQEMGRVFSRLVESLKEKELQDNKLDADAAVVAGY